MEMDIINTTRAIAGEEVNLVHIAKFYVLPGIVSYLATCFLMNFIPKKFKLYDMCDELLMIGTTVAIVYNIPVLSGITDYMAVLSVSYLCSRIDVINHINSLVSKRTGAKR